MSFNSFLRLCGLVLLVIAGHGLVVAQGTGTISGRAVDSAGAVSAAAPRASSTANGSGGSRRTPGAHGLTRTWLLARET
jgi:hypothetical protein